MSVASKYAREREGTFEEKVIRELLGKDPAIARFEDLPEDVKSRERWHLRHSVAGFRPYLESK
jgi:hypothetical protein